MNRVDAFVAALDEWARGQYGLAAGANSREQRRAFLATVRREKFFPSADIVEARQALVAGKSGPSALASYPRFSAAAEEKLQRQYEQFAAKLFHYAPAERQRLYEKLQASCVVAPRLSVGLSALQPGLALELRSLRELTPQSRQLVLWCCEQFTSAPRARAARRHEIWEEIRPRLTSWELAARHFVKQHPQIAALAPELMTPLARPPAVRNSAAQRGLTPPLSPGATSPVRQRTSINLPSWQLSSSAGVGLIILIRIVLALFNASQREDHSHRSARDVPPATSTRMSEYPSGSMPAARISQQAHGSDDAINGSGVMPGGESIPAQGNLRTEISDAETGSNPPPLSLPAALRQAANANPTNPEAATSHSNDGLRSRMQARRKEDNERRQQMHDARMRTLEQQRQQSIDPSAEMMRQFKQQQEASQQRFQESQRRMEEMRSRSGFHH